MHVEAHMFRVEHNELLKAKFPVFYTCSIFPLVLPEGARTTVTGDLSE